MVVISGGDKLAARLQELSKNITKAASVEIGFMSDATYPDGTPVAMVAAVQEFGAPSRNIPPRPFMRGLIAEKSDSWGNAVADLLEANDYDARRTLEQAGDGIKGQLQQAIRDYVGPALAPATVAAKGSSKQLVDTGTMLNSVTYKVE